MFRIVLFHRGFAISEGEKLGLGNANGLVWRRKIFFVFYGLKTFKTKKREESFNGSKIRNGRGRNEEMDVLKVFSAPCTLL